MSESSFFPWVSATQVAQRFGVTGAYVRKLVAEGKFPRPIRAFPGVQLFSAADVDAWAQARTMASDPNSKRPHTAQAALAIQADQLLDQPGAPLRLTTDVVRTWQLPPRCTVHVRIYRGSERIVVLLSEPAVEGQGHGLKTHIELIVEQVTRELITEEEAEQAHWIDIWPTERHEEAGYKLSNLLMSHDRRTHQWSDPTWAPLSLDDLDALLRGAHVDWYDWDHYTPELIQQWQRDARPVEVVHDAQGYAPALDALQKLSTPQAQDRLGEATRVARSALMGLLALQHSGRGWGSDAPALVNTSRRVPLELPEEIVAALPDTEELAAGDFDEEVVRYDQLQQALYLVDRDAATPDPDLAAALEYARAAQISTLRLIDPQRSLDRWWLPTGTPRHIEIIGAWGRAYLERCTWESAAPTALDPIEQHHRNAIARDCGQRPRVFGRDPFGSLVCRYEIHDHSGSAIDCLGIWWPTTYPGAAPLPAETHLVGDSESGDLAVWLMRRGELVGLLPRTQPDHQWNFGYSGGGPGTLTRAIAEFMASTGRPVDLWSLDQQVCDPHMKTDGLDINLDRLPAPRPAG